MSLGERIKQLRQAHGLTQNELAQLINSSQRQVWKYEANQNEPTSGVIVSLARALNTSTDYLLGLTQNPEQIVRDTDDLSQREKAIIKAVRTGKLDEVVRTFIGEG